MSSLSSPSARLDALVPRPRSAAATGGVTTLPPRPGVAGPVAWVDAAVRLLGAVGAVPVGDEAEASILVREEAGVPASGYRLDVGDVVEVAASELDGVLNAVQTLRQLLDPRFGLPAAPTDTPRDLPRCRVEDAPLYRWRGLLLDVARHFFPLSELFGFVELAAAHKLNVLHLHLTDDQGWRFEVRSHPLLTEVGAHRSETHWPARESGDGTPHGGYYSQDQLRCLVAFAAERGVTIVPEIDVPGHVRALLAAYPEYGLGGQAGPVATRFEIFPEVLWPDDRAVALVEDVFAELLDVFPSEVIHIGGDECPRVQWEGNPDAEALAAERGLAGAHELQRWFTQHLRDWLSARGRRVIGWDEVVAGGDVEDAVVMSWRGAEPGRRALADGHEVVMTPSPLVYLDYFQAESPDEPQGRWPVRTWADIVEFDPGAGVPDADLPRLLGVQGSLWTEFVATLEHLRYMAWPKLCAVAEVAWAGPCSPEEFEPRLRAHLERLDAVGIGYRPLDGPRPWQKAGTGVRRHRDWQLPQTPHR